MKTLVCLALSAVVLATAACSSQPKSDDDKVRALYADITSAAKAGDANRLRELTCPQLRTTNDYAEWIKSANDLEYYGARAEIKDISGPKDGDADSPDIQAWKKVGPLAVAKIDGEWYLCER